MFLIAAPSLVFLFKAVGGNYSSFKKKIHSQMQLSNMEFLQPSIPFLFAFLLFIYMIVSNFKTSKARYAPGPWKLPLIGNLHQLAGSLPHHSLRDLSKKHGPVMYLQLGEVPALVLSSPKAVEEVTKNHGLNFLNRPEIMAAKIIGYNGTGLTFAPYGDYYKHMRKICTLELLSSKRVQSFRSLREEEVKKLVKSILSSTGVPINLSEKIFALTNRITSRAAFGKSYDHRDFTTAIKEVVTLSGGFDIPDLFPSLKLLHGISKVKDQLEKLHVRIDDILSNIIDDHREKQNHGTTSTKESGEEDLVDVLLKIQKSNGIEFPITTNNIKAIILDIYAAGTDSSSTTLEWAMSELVKNPLVMNKAQAEVRHIIQGKRDFDETDTRDMSYLKLVIKETLRLHSPVPLLVPREAKEACQINGYNIPKGTKVIVNAWAIGRDEKYWEDAESFEPDRFKASQIDFKGNNFEYIPFGAGKRMCPGILFGNANMELPLAQLLYHFDWKLPNGMKAKDLDMTEAFGAVLKRKNGLHLIGIPYTPQV